MAQLILPSQLRGRRFGAAAMTTAARRRQGRMPLMHAVADDVQGYTRALTQDLGGPLDVISASVRAAMPAAPPREYLQQSAVSLPSSSVAPDLRYMAPAQAGMSTGTKLAIGAGVVGGLYLLAKAVM